MMRHDPGHSNTSVQSKQESLSKTPALAVNEMKSRRRKHDYKAHN